METTDEDSYDPEKKNGFVVDGMTLPPKQANSVPWEKHITDIRGLELRESDVFICAYPKAGTHWLWEVTHMLLSGKVEYETRTKENLMMEFLTKDLIDSLPSPRILNTHLYPSILPVQQIREKKVKVLHVYRNPKDTVVSMYFHFRQVFPKLKDYSLLQFVQLFLRDDIMDCLSAGMLSAWPTGTASTRRVTQVVYGNYFNYLRQMESFIRSNPDIPVFSMAFEDMKRQSPVNNVQQLAEFLGADASEDLCEKIADACSFKNMRKADETKALPDISNMVMTKDTALYRKGEVGDWKNYLTVAMSEMIDQAVEDRLAGSMFSLQFT